MALSLLVIVPALFGTAKAIEQTQAKARREEHRSRACNLVIRCSKSSHCSPLLEGRRVVLSGNKLYIDTGKQYEQPFGHPFSGYFMKYPDTTFEGLISSIAVDPPIMNWIFVDRESHEVKFGNRAAAEPNLTGPFDVTRQDKRLKFAGWEGFVAVLEDSGFWALYFDRDGDNLKAKVKAGTPVLEVELLRKEVREMKKMVVEHDFKTDAQTEDVKTEEGKADEVGE